MNLFDCTWEEFEAQMARLFGIPLNIYRGLTASYRGLPREEPGTRTLKSGAIVRDGKAMSTAEPVRSATVLATRTVGRITITRYA